MDIGWVIVVLLSILSSTAVAASAPICRVQIAGGTLGNVASAAISCKGATVSITGAAALTPFIGNFSGVTFTAGNESGAFLQIEGQQVDFQSSSFTNLAPSSGSILALSNGMFTLTECTFSGNTARKFSAILAINSSDVMISKSTFSGNSVDEYGGAVLQNTGTLTVTGSRFLGNTAGLSGGAIAITAAKSLVIMDSTFTKNSAGCKGGHIYTSFVDTVNSTNTVYDQGTVTTSFQDSANGGNCVTLARYTSTTGSGNDVEMFTTSTWINSTFTRNGGYGAGAGLFMLSGITGTVTACKFSDNLQPNAQGSALMVSKHVSLSQISHPYAPHLVVRERMASQIGTILGALAVQQTATVYISDNVFSGNQVLTSQMLNNQPGVGGAMALVASCNDVCLVRRNRFTGNLVNNDGGALYASSPGNLNIFNNTFASNSAGLTGGAMSVISNGQSTSTTVLNISGNVYTDNKVTGNGGALAVINIQSLDMEDCHFSESTASSLGGAMFINAGSSSSINISGCSFHGNQALVGGGAYLYQSRSFSIITSNFTSNNAIQGSGGGFYAVDADTFSSDSNTFLNNTAADTGGAWATYTVSNITFSNAKFTGNSASTGYGGAVYVTDFDHATMSSCSYNGNTASSASSGSGGAVSFQIGSSVVINNSSFVNNAAADLGGAVHLEQLSGGLVAQESVFSGNSAGSDGGSMQVQAMSSLNLTDCVFVSNTAGGAGGAVAAKNVSSAVLLASDTVTNNSAATQGGAVAVSNSTDITVSLLASTFASNTAPQGSVLFVDTGTVISSSPSAATPSIACGSCQYKAPGATSFTTLTSDTLGTASPGGSSGAGLSGGAVAGIVIGVTLLTVLVTALILVFLLKRRKRAAMDIELSKPSDPDNISGVISVKSMFAGGTGDGGSFWSSPRKAAVGEGAHVGGRGSTGFVAPFDGMDSGGLGNAYLDIDSIGGASTINSRVPLMNINTGMSDMSFVSNATSQLTGMTGASALTANNDWQIDASAIEIVKRADGSDWVLGDGAFGQVLKATLNGVNPVAIKVLKDQSPGSREVFWREVAMLKNLRNSNIVQFQGACLDDQRMLLITEFCDGGDLMKAIAKRQISWPKRGKGVAVDVLRGLHYLHTKRIVHLDLKTPNILLTRHGQAKLADVGLSKVIQGQNYLTQLSVIGSFAWAAPEVLTNERCTEKADMFSFGIVLWEIVTGEAPIRGGRREVRPEECPQAVADLIDALLRTDPNKRPTAQEALDVVLKLS